MGRDKYVGRVGALAVALGIGSAVTAMPGQAWAQPDSGSSAGTSESTASSVKEPNATRSSGSAGTGHDADANDTSDTTGNLPKERSSDGGNRGTAEDPREARTVRERDSVRSLDRDRGALNETDAEETTPRRTRQAPESAPAPSVESVEIPVNDDTDGTETAKPAGTRTPAPTPGLATVLLSLFSAKPATGTESTPGSPGAASALWTLLGSARREQEATSVPIPGEAYESPVISTDGTVYQVTTDAGGPTRVSVLDHTGQVLVTSEDIRGSFVRSAARPDNSLIVVTRTTFFSTVSAVDSDGDVTRLATLIGLPENRFTVGANGAVYVRTSIPKLFDPAGGAIGFRTYRISPTNTVRSFAFDTDLALAPDGTAYLVSSQNGFSTLRVIRANGVTRATALPFGAEVSAPVLAQDGTAFVTAGVTPFGVKQTRVYTATSGTTTARTVTGLPGETVVAADGVYLETFTYSGSTDNGTGTTYISRLTATGLDTSEVIDGRIAGFQVTPDGSVYAPLADPTLTDTPVAVVGPDGTVRTVTLPGTLVVGRRTIRDGGSQGAENVGYVNYAADGREYVAVLGPDATVLRTLELPEGATGGSVFFGPDGGAYELLEYRNTQGQTVSRQILALPTSTYTAVVPGARFTYVSHDVVFGPDGVGYLLTGSTTGLPGNPLDLDVLGFNAAGDTVARASGLTNPAMSYENNPARRVLAFDRDGTAHVTLYFTEDDPGVYAVTAGGAQKIADLDYAPRRQAYLPTFGIDGTGYVTTGSVFLSDPDGTTTVTTFTPPSEL